MGLALRLSPLQLGFHGFADELRAPARPGQGVNALHDGLRQANLRGFHTERGATHARSGRRYRFVGQSLHFSDTAYLTPLGDTAYIIGIGYGDKQMTAEPSKTRYVSPNGYSDDYGPNVSQILAQGTRVIVGRVPARVRAELRLAVRDGVLGHLPKDGLKPEIFFHPNRRNGAKELQQREATYAVGCIASVVHVPTTDEKIAEALAKLGLKP
jgi:hypothetical protein